LLRYTPTEDTLLRLGRSRFLRIGNDAVREARAENRRLGIPNVFSVDGLLCRELPDGEITFEDPDADDSSQA
jgi:hypothetical protein